MTVKPYINRLLGCEQSVKIAATSGTVVSLIALNKDYDPGHMLLRTDPLTITQGDRDEGLHDRG